MEFDENSVAALGLWPGAKFSPSHKDLKGISFKVVSGFLPPNSESRNMPTHGPFAGPQRARDRTDHGKGVFINNEIEVNVTAIGCKHYTKNEAKYKENGIELGVTTYMSVITGMFNGRFMGYDTATLMHDPIPTQMLYQGRVYDIERAAWTDVSRQGVFVKCDDWALEYPVENHGVRAMTTKECINDVVTKNNLSRACIEEAFEIVEMLPVTVLYDVLRGIIRTRPKEIVMGPTCVVAVDTLHAIIAFRIINGGMMNFDNIGAVSGTFRYAYIVANELFLYRYPYPELFAAIGVLSQNDNTWVMSSMVVARCVRFNMIIAGDIREKPLVSQLTLVLCMKIGIDGPVPGRTYEPIPTYDIQYPIYKFSFAKFTFFETCVMDYPRHVECAHELRNTTAPWSLSIPDDFYYSQFMEWNNMTPTCREVTNPSSTERSYVYKIGPGWLSSIIGMQPVYAGQTDLMVSMNLFAVDGEPLVIRKAATDASDVPESIKALARAEFLDMLKSETGIRFKHCPKSIPEFTSSNALRLMPTGPEIIKLNTKGEVVSILKFQSEIPIVRKHKVRAPENPTQDWRTVWIEADTIADNADAIVAEIIAAFTPSELRRAGVLMRHFNSTIEMVVTPVLYEEDRAVYKLLCAMAVVFAPMIKRESYKFTIVDGATYWCVIRRHLGMAKPTHYNWNVSYLLRLRDYDGATGNLVAVTDGERALNVRGFYIKGMPDKNVSYAADCVVCTDGIPKIRQACGHVLTCEKCASKGLPSICPVCTGPVHPLEAVMAAPFMETDVNGQKLTISKQVNMFSWQQAALNKLCMFTQRSEVIWLPPGSGKTEVIMRYIRFCNSHDCMTKFLIWVTVPVAIPNLVGQAQRAGIPFKVLERREMPQPGMICIVKNSDIMYMDLALLGPHLGDLTFVLDEFHTCMSSNTKRALVCLEIAKGAARTIPMSGTVYKNRSSPGELANFLALCVDFQVTALNFQTALGLLISFRVPSKSMIRRFPIHIGASPGRDGIDQQKLEMGAAENHMMELAIKSVREEEIGCIVAVDSATRAVEIAELLNNIGIRALAQNSQNPVNIGPSVCRDSRGPGYILASQSQTVVPNGGLRASADDDDEEVNESWRLPQIIVVPLKTGFCEGYELNRYRRMYFTVLPSNEANRTQLEGRIDRANNDAIFVEYFTIVAPSMEHLFSEHEIVRAKADALRDITAGNDATRRVYDSTERDRCKAEANETRRRANEQQAEIAGSHSPAMQRLAGACTFLGIGVNPVKGALLFTAKEARKTLLRKWHPDLWASGTQQERTDADQFTVKINLAFDIIETYCKS